MGGCDGCGTGGGGCACPFASDEPFSLFGGLPDGWVAGGWLQFGYHSAGSGSRFNSRPNDVQLHQAWFYAEKEIDTSDGFDIGGRVDYLYGSDAPDTQAFGIANDHWDNGWRNGNDYGHALPQAYAQLGYGDLSVKLGHFYTIIGWEVVQAPDNFFYSHAYTMYNSEPFTHTGALATLEASDDVTIYGGYTLGWDSGFEDNGDSFLGGVSASLTDSVSLTYATVFGRFQENSGINDNGATANRGYMHSVVLDVAMTDNFQWILQSDLLNTEDASGVTSGDTFGINQYFIYNISDCMSAGARFEWWNVGDAAGNDSDVYDLTLGLNVFPSGNVIVRPEVRWDWDSDRLGVNQNGEASQTTFGVDTILTF